MPSHLRDLVDDLRILVPIAIPGRTGSLTIAGDPSFERIRQATRATIDDPELDMLSPAELRALKTFRITVYRSASASPEVARRQIGAVWRGEAKQAFLKLSVGDEVEAAMRDLMLGGIG
jgi:hypothetical protein